MNLQEIEERVARLDLSEGPTFIHSLLLAYGIPKAALSRLRSGTYNRSSRAGETLSGWPISTEGADEDAEGRGSCPSMSRGAGREIATDSEHDTRRAWGMLGVAGFRQVACCPVADG